jgi:ketosteroid isomerase-like protein
VVEESENVELVRRMWEAFERGGLEAILDFAAPEAVWVPYSASNRVFHSTEEYRAYIRQMAERGDVVEARLGEIEERGDWVLVSGGLRMRRSGALRDTTMHWVHRIEDGRVTYTASYPSRERVLAAAGLKD